mmetsp:Transcript_77675/g.167997  ORF Transcript_77675/g.167997 Transcript_77675/m.167997 type:complete len:222 (-) Transcript_77675:37-702(-)
MSGPPPAAPRRLRQPARGGAMNFVRAETLVQEITADGKVRDIVTTRVKSEREKEEERKEETIRNLPEFKRMRGQDDRSAGAQVSKEDELTEEADKREEEKKFNVHTIDEDEYEHYESLATKERDQKRQRVLDDAAASASYEAERRLAADGDSVVTNALMDSMRQQQLDKAKRQGTAPTAADRLKGLVKVKAKAGAAPSKSAAPEPQGGGIGLVGYGSDSDS